MILVYTFTVNWYLCFNLYLVTMVKIDLRH